MALDTAKTRRWMPAVTVWAVLLVCVSGCNEEAPVRIAGRLGCMLNECHARVEHIHYGGASLDCVDCHGGNGSAITIETAHVTTTVSFNPSSPGGQAPGGRILEGASLAELDELDPTVLQFLNPSDYRVVSQTCGSSTRGGGNCHVRIVQNSIMSTHATLSGQIAGGLFFGGLDDRESGFAVSNATDPFPIDRYGTAASLTLLPPSPVGMMPTGAVAEAYYTSMSQLCVGCHIGRDGDHSPGLYTSSGCNACHLLTNDDGRAATADVTQNREEIGHGALHRFTNLIPDSQCNRCHHAHLQRGLLAQGVRERSEPEGDAALGGFNRGVEDPEHARFWGEENYVRYQGEHSLYGKPYPFYIEDEDSTNDIDETPPDIHTEMGMACIDCHTTPELHGGDHMPVRREFETQVRCESCHGDPGGRLDPETLQFNQSLSRVGGNADNPRVITVDEAGELFQLGKLDRNQHHVTQIAQRVDPTEALFNPRTLMGCGLHAGPAEYRAALLAFFVSTAPDQVDEVFPGMPEASTLPADLGSRAGRLECFTCHNAWTMNCYGCHVERDDQLMVTNQVTGVVSPGRVSNFAMSVVSDALALGFGTRGRVTPMVGTSIFFSHVSSTGGLLINAEPLLTTDGLSGHANEHNPVHHHTIRRQPRDCQGCHPRADGLGDEDVLKRAIGFGTGDFVFIDGRGQRHILDSLLTIDFDGDGVADDPTTTSIGAEAMSVSPRAASTHLSLTSGPGPGPLDRVTINRMIQNRVVPQRP